MDLMKINGMKPNYVEELYFVGVNSVEGLLHKCATSYEIERMAEQTKIDAHIIQDWLKYAGLLKKKH
ncbi:MAG: hypothetical protein JW997_06045 [Actinobacteria bacterium]|nr:hypothetical protein [Actinomycetota bacterium]